MNETTETREFDSAAAEDVLNRVQGLGEDETIALILSIRAPDDDFGQVLDECWHEIENQAKMLDVTVSEFDSFIDQKSGKIHLKANANLARMLTQRDDFFHSVAYDDSRWR